MGQHTKRQKAEGSRSKEQRAKCTDEGLDTLIERAYSQAVAEHGDFGLRLQDFAARLDSVIAKHLRANLTDDDAANFAAGLQTDDLYLTTACALTDSNIAWERLWTLYRSYIHAVAHNVCSNRGEATEVANNMLSHLFFADREGHRRIAEYEGRAPLWAWLAMITKRQAINHGRVKAKEALSLDSLTLTPSSAVPNALEAELIDREAREAMAQSLRAAAEKLSERERLVLRLRVEEELAPAEIARRFDVHRARITCVLHRAEKKMRSLLAV